MIRLQQHRKHSIITTVSPSLHAKIKVNMPAALSREVLAKYEPVIGLGMLLALLIRLGGSVTAFAQLDAPAAFSDFAGCSHHTCTWVPWSTHKIFQKGDLTYAVETKSTEKSGGVFVLRRADRELLRTPLKDLSASVSVVWSDDKNRIAITWSDGGAIGNFHVRAVKIEGEAASELPATQPAFSEFKAHHWCEARGDNIQAYRWMPDSSALVLVLSVYNTSDCGKEMGHTEAYVVDAATGNIRQHWGVNQLNAYIRAHPEW